MFEHVDLNLPPIKRETIDGVRYYSVPDEDELIKLVSITSQAILIKFLILILIGIFFSYSIPNILGNKIGGFNGDACGASVVLVETAMLFMHAILL